VSLPDAPLARFRAQTVGLPQTTEAERLTILRIGQDIFRAALIDYWGGRCPITGVTDPALLRASHVVPWSECDDAQRLDVHNGLLLSALWDAAFDAGLISFADDGTVLASPELTAAAPSALGLERAPRLATLRDAHCANLATHRGRHGFSRPRNGNSVAESVALSSTVLFVAGPRKKTLTRAEFRALLRLARVGKIAPGKPKPTAPIQLVFDFMLD
jgi:HNH endonuclease